MGRAPNYIANACAVRAVVGLVHSVRCGMAGDGHEDVVGMCEPSGEKKWAEWEQERVLLGNEALVCERDVSQVFGK